MSPGCTNNQFPDEKMVHPSLTTPSSCPQKGEKHHQPPARPAASVEEHTVSCVALVIFIVLLVEFQCDLLGEKKKCQMVDKQ